MHDFLYRGLWKNLGVRFSYVSCGASANEAVVRHNCDPMSAHLLSRAIGAGLLTCPLLAEDESCTFRWNYGGAAKTVMVDVNWVSHVRGFILPPNLSSAVSSEEDVYGETGTLTVVRSDSKRTLNSGVAEARLLDVVEDLAYFFCVSDQLETGMAVLVGFSRNPEQPVALCRGLMLQAMPDCDLTVFERMRSRIGSETCRGFLGEPQDTDNAFERVLDSLADGEADAGSYRITLASPPAFCCSCSRERMVSVVATLDRNEIRNLLAERGCITVTCQFCATQHTLRESDLAEVLKGSVPEEA